MTDSDSTPNPPAPQGETPPSNPSEQLPTQENMALSRRRADEALNLTLSAPKAEQVPQPPSEEMLEIISIIRSPSYFGKGWYLSRVEAAALIVAERERWAANLRHELALAAEATLVFRNKWEDRGAQLAALQRENAELKKAPPHTHAQWKAFDEIERLLDNTATLLRRLVHALPSPHPLRKTATDYLKENDLLGSKFRESNERDSDP